MNTENLKTNLPLEATYMELGKFYFLNNKYDEAVSEFKKVLEINPANAEAYYNIGLIKESSNLIDDAKEMYSKALSINSEYKIVKDRLDKLIGIENKS
ncbi:MAG: tetratricopeptide repeat protein [Endomicrobium sp.]|jgi:tetratricopeptide (TPR) repeat protein|uniref:tetratricopeptide repeat protein n=1 Tax=Candidatus Endomicrobiellum cubanum TaxID=3242325 RepID=UPI0028310963|nr:tetratricopeptide repeat protein [Endomicrobium sp.]MDR2395410.1 tetratricopeptide repeat protein [Endomicrobium sp.]